MRKIIVVSNGGGTNTTGLLAGLHEKGIRPDYITFADTCGEKPHTYEHLKALDKWLLSVGFPTTTVVRGSQPAQVRRGSLEAEGIELGTLPSKVYGFGKCSEKWKMSPQNKFDKALIKTLGIAPENVIRFIGFDAGEPGRAERAVLFGTKTGVTQRFPLVEWGWGRAECVAAIERAGLKQPGKSACFFCPSSKKSEVLWLKENHPDLLARAIAMERRALRGEGRAPAFKGKGLGRHWSWEELAYGDSCGLIEDPGTPSCDCGCYDG